MSTLKNRYFTRFISAITITTVTATTLFALHSASANEMEEVVVKGSKIPKSITEITHSVTVVSEVEIENQAFTDVTEILRQQAGIEFKQAGGVGQFNYLKLRGLAADNVLVVVDGVKINRASGGDTRNLLSQIDPSSIESVEILRGPQATLYGANSTAGVIVINTKSGSRPDTRIRAQAGSMNWKKVSGSVRNNVETANGQWLYSLNLSTTDSDNTHKYEYFEDRTIQGKLSYKAASWSLGFSVFDVQNDFGYAELDDASCCQTEASYWGYQTPDPDQHSETGEAVYSLTGEHRITESLTQKIQFSTAENTYTINDRDDRLLGTVIATHDGIVTGSIAGDTLYIYDRNRGISATPLAIDPAADSDVQALYEDSSIQVDYQLLFAGEGFNLLGGIEYQDQSARQWGSYGASDNEDSQVSYYTNGDVDLFNSALILSLGVRLDDYESWGTETTGNIGFAWHITDGMTLYGNVGNSFKPATMSQLFNPSYGDSSLSPETGRTMELGLRHVAIDDKLSLETTLWNTEIDSVIFFDYSIVNPRRSTGFGQYNNGSEAESKGVEVKFSYLFTDALSLVGNYTYTDSQRRAVGADWVPTVQIAKNKGNIGVNYEAERWFLGANAYYTDPRLRWAGDLSMDRYIRVDLSGHYQLNQSIKLSFRIENLLDDDIKEGYGYEEPGRYGIVGIDYQF